jgi:hypothetical protein
VASPTEELRNQVHKFACDLSAMAEREKTVQRDMDRLLVQSEKHRQDIDDLRQDDLLLRQRLDDHLKRFDKWEHRLWGIVMLLAGALLTSAAGLIVAWAKK